MKFLQFYAKNEEGSSDIHLAYDTESKNFIMTHREIEKYSIIRGKQLMQIADIIL